MKKINILSERVYNRIAAGEVVDRPYSAVKELVENSIDAGATEIEIYIERGGKQLIKVADNGSGIYKDDLQAAFLPHATSKISGVSDLDNIKTLGFRGEALASIASISKTEIISVTDDNPAYKITCNGGDIGAPQLAALEKGTVISVRDLFYNTPVRAKFLKPDKKEETDITSYVARFILANPCVSFKYYADGKLILQSFGGGLEEAVAQVYGAKVISQCIKINAEKDGVHLYGYISNQNFFKPNKSYQSVFLNGRYIVNNTIAVAISNAYASYAMKRQFPFYVLNIDVPGDIVDVNVHPNKADVRFIDNNFIFGVVYKVISSVLDGTAQAAEFVVGGRNFSEIKTTPKDENVGKEGAKTEVAPQKETVPQEIIDKYKPPVATEFPEDNFKKPAEDSAAAEAAKPKRPFDPERDLSLVDFFGSDFQTPAPNQEPFGVGDASLETNPYIAAAQEIERKYFERKQARIDYENCKFRGSMFNTYLIYEYRDNVYIVDQHAAHERLIYDKLVKNVKARKVARQPLLLPYVFDVNAEELQFIEKNIGILKELGFTVTHFGEYTYRVDEIPADLQEMDLREFFDEILADISSYKEIKLEEVLKDKLATTACKHAVKGGMELNEQEVGNLIKMMDGDMGLKCPHGRPVCVTLTKRDIEKMFKRIV